MVFTVEQVRGIRQGKITATLILPSEPVSPDRVRVLRRSVTREDGTVIIEKVMDTALGGERIPALITVMAVADFEVAQISYRLARACGHLTTDGAAAAWRAEHSRSLLAQAVWFELGDVRDRKRLLARTGSPGGDYTTSSALAIYDAGEALTATELVDIVAGNHQRDLQRRAATQHRLAVATPAQRMARIEGASEAMTAEVRHELRIIGQRTHRAERQLQRKRGRAEQ